MFVGTPGSSWHKHAILAQSRREFLPVSDNLRIFFKTPARLFCRTAPRRDRGDGHSKWQSVAHQFYNITHLDAHAGSDTLTIETHMPPGHRSLRERLGLVKLYKKKPAVYSQTFSIVYGFSWARHWTTA